MMIEDLHFTMQLKPMMSRLLPGSSPEIIQINRIISETHPFLMQSDLVEEDASSFVFKINFMMKEPQSTQQCTTNIGSLE